MRKLLVAGVGAAVVLIAALVVWIAFVRDDAPAAFELSETAGEEVGDGGDEGAADDGLVTLDGTWIVGEGSEAGYRVVEDLGDVLDFEAVGRTSTVTGSLDISGASVDAASFEVDVASITSDDGRRDTQFREKIMNAAEFPTATFVLTAPIDLGATPAEGEPVSTTASGELTLRDVTNPVTLNVEAQLVGGRIELVGTIPVLFSEYGIANPSNPLVEVRDEGQVEVQLFLDPS